MVAESSDPFSIGTTREGVFLLTGKRVSGWMNTGVGCGMAERWFSATVRAVPTDLF